MFHDSSLRREAEKLARKARVAKLERQHADMIRADREKAESDARIVADWQARFAMARNAACEGQKNFRGIGQVA